MQVKAYAKVNLSLNIYDRRTDGYHEISSVMQTISLADDLQIELTDSSTIELEVDGPYAEHAPPNESNLVYRAAQAVLTMTASTQGAKIKLTKNIPAQAGLGGGSSDAGSTLRALNRLLGSPLTTVQLLPIAAKLGGDVPFFLYGGTCLVEGVGERVTPMPPYHATGVVVKPAIGVSTKTAYDWLDNERRHGFIRKSSVWDGSLSSDFIQLISEHSEMKIAREAMLKPDGGTCTQVTICGSGSALFGIWAGDGPPFGAIESIIRYSKGDLFSVKMVTREEIEQQFDR